MKLNGKSYNVEVVNGIPMVEGKTVDEFIRTLNFETLLQAAVVGKLVTEDDATTRMMKSKRKRHDQYKKRSPQKMLNELYQAKNN